jgi:hypothetical protein
LIRALTNLNCPPGLEISFTEKDLNEIITSAIKNLLNKNTIRHTALACVTLQQGNRDEENILAKLPQEMLENIYAKAFSAEMGEQKRKNFVRNISRLTPVGLFAKNADYVKNENVSKSQSDNLESLLIEDYEVIADKRPMNRFSN